MIDVFLVIAVGVLWSQIPLHGSASLRIALTLLYLLTTPGLVSPISATQQQAMMTTTFFFLNTNDLAVKSATFNLSEHNL